MERCAHAQCSVQPTEQPLTADSSFPGMSEASFPDSLSPLLKAPWSQHKHLPPLITPAPSTHLCRGCSDPPSGPAMACKKVLQRAAGVQVARLRLRSEPEFAIQSQSSPIHFSVPRLLQRPGSQPRGAVVLTAYTHSHSIFQLLSRVTLPVPKTPGLTRSAGPGSLSSGYICQCAP